MQSIVFVHFPMSSTKACHTPPSWVQWVPDSSSLSSAICISIIVVLPISDLLYPQPLDSNDFSSLVYIIFILQWGLKAVTFLTMAKWAGPAGRKNLKVPLPPCRLQQILAVSFPIHSPWALLLILWVSKYPSRCLLWLKTVRGPAKQRAPMVRRPGSSSISSSEKAPKTPPKAPGATLRGSQKAQASPAVLPSI